MAVFSAIASIVGAKAQKKGLKKARKAIGEAVERTVDLQQGVYEDVKESTSAWKTAGEDALAQIVAGIADGSFDISKFDFEADPGYQFRLSEGMKALDRGAAARGNLLSGAQIKGSQRFAQNFASAEYQNVFNRQMLAKQSNFGQLAGVAGGGQWAAGLNAQAGWNFANRAGNAIMLGATGVAENRVAAGNVQATMYGNLGELAKSTVGNVLTYGMT